MTDHCPNCKSTFIFEIANSEVYLCEKCAKTCTFHQLVIF